MRRVAIVIGFAMVAILSACKNIENEEDQVTPDLIRNEHVLAKTLLHTECIHHIAYAFRLAVICYEL